MLRKITIAILPWVFVAVTAAADGLVVTRASVSPSTALPATAVWFSFEVRNASDHPIALPSNYVIEITPPSGEPFLAHHVTSFVAALPQAYRSEATLAAGESRVVDFPTGPALADSFFRDERLWQPGTWRFRIILSNELHDDFFERSHWSALMGTGSVTAPPLVTPAISLTIEEPKGVDAEAWKALRALPSVGSLNGPKGGEIAKQFWEKYRNSRYAPYFGMVAAQHIRRTGGDDRFQVASDIYERVIALDGDGIFIDDLRMAPAINKALDAAAADSLASAVRATNDARVELEAVASTAKHELTRMRARTEARKLKSPNELKAKFASR